MNIKANLLIATCLGVIFPSLYLTGCQAEIKAISLKEESLQTLKVLAAALYHRQISDVKDLNDGALRCENCNVLHTRAAEAVYPFSIVYQQTADEKYLQAAIRLGNWLIKQQFADGSWKETPEKWTGTTTDQLLMMVLAQQILRDKLSDTENKNWEISIRRAADYLTAMMSPDFASINYCTTTAASLAMTHHYYPDEKYIQKARLLARQILSKTDEEGFIKAEGDRVYGVKYGSDIGYELDMSLWGLAIYARLADDPEVKKMVEKSLRTHLYFVYPNGAIDGSWGIRSNKWTTYGSATADGCQILFSLFADQDDRYRTAAYKNLEYLRTMIKDGLVGYGPHYWEIFDRPPCIYPTFTRVKNLAMTVAMGEQGSGPCPDLPTQQPGMIRYFPTMDVVVVRSENFMTTITAYRYKDLKKTFKSKYMHRPGGGSISNLWVENYGFLQVGGQTEYQRWEPMSFPIVENTRCITPRIEFKNENGYFTNLYEFDGRMTVEEDINGATAVITTSGELSDKNLLPGGVAYSLQHAIFDDAIEKSVKLRYHDGLRTVKLVEPIVWQKDMKIEVLGEKKIRIESSEKTFLFEITKGNVELSVDINASDFWSVYPSVKTIPIILAVSTPADEFRQEIIYRFSLQE